MASIIRFQHHCYLSSHDSRSHNKYGCSITSPHSRANTNDRILKALGATNWSIRKIFLYNSFTLFAEDCFGNLIGISLLLVQQQFGIIQLPPENYYVNQAPVYLNWGYILLKCNSVCVFFGTVNPFLYNNKDIACKRDTFRLVFFGRSSLYRRRLSKRIIAFIYRESAIRTSPR
jgi:hypothetical protein